MKDARGAGGDNRWLAAQLRELAARLELEGVPHRPRAYRRAADTVEQQPEAIRALRDRYGARGLDDLPGIGPHIAGLLVELIDTGGSRALERLRKEIPVDVVDLLSVDGVGPKTLKLLWDELRIRSLDDLEAALEDGRVEALRGFGQRRVERLQRAVRIRRRGRERMPRERAAGIARPLLEALSRHPAVIECSIAGSLRRGEASVGDIDIVVASRDAPAVAAYLLERPEVESVYSRGPNRVSVRLGSRVDLDVRTVPPESYGSALLYFTGSRAHTLALRRLALAEGFRLNEYGLFDHHQRIAGADESGIYAALSLPYLPPERRRGESEIRQSLRERGRATRPGSPPGKAGA